VVSAQRKELAILEKKYSEQLRVAEAALAAHTRQGPKPKHLKSAVETAAALLKRVQTGSLPAADQARYTAAEKKLQETRELSITEQLARIAADAGHHARDAAPRPGATPKLSQAREPPPHEDALAPEEEEADEEVVGPAYYLKSPRAVVTHWEQVRELLNKKPLAQQASWDFVADVPSKGSFFLDNYIKSTIHVYDPSEAFQLPQPCPVHGFLDHPNKVSRHGYVDRLRRVLDVSGQSWLGGALYRCSKCLKEQTDLKVRANAECKAEVRAQLQQDLKTKYYAFRSYDPRVLRFWFQRFPHVALSLMRFVVTHKCILTFELFYSMKFLLGAGLAPPAISQFLQEIYSFKAGIRSASALAHQYFVASTQSATQRAGGQTSMSDFLHGTLVLDFCVIVLSYRGIASSCNYCVCTQVARTIDLALAASWTVGLAATVTLCSSRVSSVGCSHPARNLFDTCWPKSWSGMKSLSFCGGSRISLDGALHSISAARP